MNRVVNKEYIELKESNGRADEIVAQESWNNHLKRNDSQIVDLFLGEKKRREKINEKGMYKSKLECPVCPKISITFDPFLFLSVPIPSKKMRTMKLIFIDKEGNPSIKKHK